MLKKSLVSLSAITAMIVLSSCGGGSSSTDTSGDTTTYTGYLVDSAVAGATYQCGDKNGTTDNEGKFECSSLPVSFSVGGIELGQISKLTTDNKIFPQDLAGVDRDDTNNSDVLKMAMILQSLDSDNNASNGISISQEQSAKFKEPINLKSLELEVIKEMMMAQDDALVFKGEEEVKAHLKASVANVKEIAATTALATLLNGKTLYGDNDQYLFSVNGDVVTIKWETLVGANLGDTGGGTWKIEGNKLVGLTGDGVETNLDLVEATDAYIAFKLSNGEVAKFYYTKPWESSSSTTTSTGSTSTTSNNSSSSSSAATNDGSATDLAILLNGKTLYADSDQYLFSVNGDIVTIKWETLVGADLGDTGGGTWRIEGNTLVGLTGDGLETNLDLVEATDGYIAFKLSNGEVAKFYYTKPWENN
jgi:hypothetical protein